MVTGKTWAQLEKEGAVKWGGIEKGYQDVTPQLKEAPKPKPSDTGPMYKQAFAQAKPLLQQSNTPMAQATASTVTAKSREVKPEETSQYQLDKILNSNSPLMQTANTQGRAYANSNGLLHSSMAAGAAQDAMIKNAQPFALNDADVYSKTASENAGFAHDASMQNSRLLTDVDVFNTGEGNKYLSLIHI